MFLTRCCLCCEDFDSKSIVRELNGLLPIVDLLKSEYAVIQSLALTALQSATEDGQYEYVRVCFCILLQCLSLSLLTVIFPGGPELAGTRISSFRIFLELRMMEMVVTNV